jgi:ribosomal-protein-alanine N-acetyltransferase
VLRPFVDGDAPRISELAGDEAVSDTTLRIPHPYSAKMALEWIGTHQKIRDSGLAIFYAIDCKESGELVGSNGMEIDPLNSRADIGYWTGREYWKRGYATEAAAGLLGFAFNVLRLHKISAHHFARNEASGRVLDKLGMKREGYLRAHVRKSGVWEDIVEYGILDHEYERLMAGLKRSE